MKKNRLYTVNKWNKGGLLFGKNLFLSGGLTDSTFGNSNHAVDFGYGYQSPTIKQQVMQNINQLQGISFDAEKMKRGIDLGVGNVKNLADSSANTMNYKDNRTAVDPSFTQTAGSTQAVTAPKQRSMVPGLSESMRTVSALAPFLNIGKGLTQTATSTAAQGAAKAVASTAAKSGIKVGTGAAKTGGEAVLKGTIGSGKAVSGGVNAASTAANTGKFASALGASKLGSLGSAGVGLAGSLIGMGANKLISNGFDTDAGNAVSDIGGTIGGVVGYFNPVIGAIVSAATGAIGGVVNRGFGMKTDGQALANAKDTAARNTAIAQSDNVFDAAADLSSAYTDPYEGGWFRQGDEEYNNWKVREDVNRSVRDVENALYNKSHDMLRDAYYNSSAYGGPINTIDSSALGIMQNDKFLRSMDYRSDALANKNTNLGLGAFTGGAKTFDGGGQLSATFVDDFSTDPIGAAVRYNQGLERMQAEKEAAAVEAQREAEYAAMQQRLANLETQNQGLQAIMAAQSQVPSLPEIPEIPETHESSSSASEATPKSGNKTWDYIENELRKSGKFNDIQIQGIKYNLQRESSIDPTVVGDGGAAFGLGQWHGSRKPKDMSLEGQTRHLIDTLSNYDGKEHWIGKGNYEGFMNARTPEEAHYYITRGYERPAQRIVDKVKRDSDMSLSRLKAFGGELGTNGTDWTNGLLYIDEGGSHEENPFDGVPMGVDAEGIPNLVEEGETVYNNYVFSNRMNVPDFMYKELGLGGVIKKGGKGMSFADASKKLAQESEQRPNDPISQAGLEASLSKLAEVQETERVRKQTEEYMGLEYACGGKMHKYGLGGNMFDVGGALEWVNRNHKGGNKKHIAAAIDSYLSKHPDLAKAKDFVKYGQAYDAIMRGSGNTGLVTPSRAGKNSDIGRKHFDELVQLGMPKNVAFGIAFPEGQGYSDREGFHSTRKEREALYGELVKGNKAVQNKSNPSVQKQASQPAKAASTQQAAQQQTPQTPTATTTTATPAQGSSGGVRKKSAVSADNSSNRNFGPKADITEGNPYPTSAPYPPSPSSTPRGAETQGIGYLAADAGVTNQEATEMGLEQTAQKAVQQTTERIPQQEDVPHYATWMRYAPVFGAGLMSMTDLLGITNKPDYTYVDRLAAAADRAGYAPHIEAEPIGNYLTYNPMDIWYQQNALNAQSRATDRALLNSNSPSRAAGLLANGYNSQLASGNLYRQALEYNDAKKQTVEDFNRKTNMFNSQMKLEADMANARYHQQAQQFGLSGLAQAAALRDQIDSRTGAAKSANLSNFFTSLGNIGRENFAMNQINNDSSRRYYGTLTGKSGYKQQGAAYGGKIKKRK